MWMSGIMGWKMGRKIHDHVPFIPPTFAFHVVINLDFVSKNNPPQILTDTQSRKGKSRKNKNKSKCVGVYRSARNFHRIWSFCSRLEYLKVLLNTEIQNKTPTEFRLSVTPSGRFLGKRKAWKYPVSRWICFTGCPDRVSIYVQKH